MTKHPTLDSVARLFTAHGVTFEVIPYFTGDLFAVVRAPNEAHKDTVTALLAGENHDYTCSWDKAGRSFRVSILLTPL